MSTIANQILVDCSYVMIEKFCNTTVANVAPYGPGLAVSITPASMVGIYPGALLVLGSSAVNVEVVNVVSVAGASFTANLNNQHQPGEILYGATFPSGQPTAPLYTQLEMLAYLADVQNDFLLKTHCLCATIDQAITTGNRFYALPPDAIRVERISLHGLELWPTAQADVDMSGVDVNAGDGLRSWFYDENPNTSVAGTLPTFGLVELPQVNDTIRLWYTQHGFHSLALNDQLLVPDPLTYILKYGVLARVFSKDGDQRDPQKADYCQRRYDFDTKLVQIFMGEMEATLGKQEQMTAATA